MSFDTKYRPRSFDDVLGQGATTRILRSFIARGAGLRQSYLFAGPYGSGKTTLGRILVRSLLCESPTEQGDPCDQCHSCKTMLETGVTLDFVEVDAATNSGKAEIQKITDELQYSTISGKRRIYLFDEAHQLSREALDALLKPLEENVPGGGDKLLVCIFCTTEPEKMRETVLSRCAPPFIIQPVGPTKISERLAYVCEQESIEYEVESLKLIAEVTECHIRDCLKAVEGISMLGAVNHENVASFLHLDTHTAYLDILEGLGRDLPGTLEASKRAMEQGSPVTVYGKLAEVAMLAYQVHIGAMKTTSYWDFSRIKALGDSRQVALLGWVERFATRPARPTPAMLFCDLASLHHGGVVMPVVQVPVAPIGQHAPIGDTATERTPAGNSTTLGEGSEEGEGSEPSSPVPPTSPSKLPPVAGTLSRVEVTAPKNLGSHILTDDRAVGMKVPVPESSGTSLAGPTDLDPGQFCHLLALHIRDLRGGQERGSTGRPNMDRGRTDPSGRSQS